MKKTLLSNIWKKEIDDLELFKSIFIVPNKKTVRSRMNLSTLYYNVKRVGRNILQITPADIINAPDEVIKYSLLRKKKLKHPGQNKLLRIHRSLETFPGSDPYVFVDRSNNSFNYRVVVSGELISDAFKKLNDLYSKIN